MPRRRPVPGYGEKKVGDRFGKFAWILHASHGQRLFADQPVAADSMRMEESRSAAQRVLRQDGVSKTGFQQALYGFRVVRFHHHTRSEPDLRKTPVDHLPHSAARGV